MSLSDVQNAQDVTQKTTSYWLLLFLLGLLLLGFGISTVHCVLSSGIDSDEVEHAHITWAVSEGIMPYRDVRQNHLPTLWIVFSPIMSALPRSVTVLIVFRTICILSLGGIYCIGLLVLKELRGRMGLLDAFLLLVLIFAVFVNFECYRFRPDPFMVLCTSCAILAAVWMRRSPMRYSALCGFALGMAASFSPKMAPLCLLIPVLCLWECMRQRTLRPIWLVIPNAAGFIAGIAPMMVWICYQGLFESFWMSAIEGNTHLLNMTHQYTLKTMQDTSLFTILTVLGCWSVLRTASKTENASWNPANGVVAGAVLAWLILILEPNHLAYNLQAFAMPAAVLNTCFLLHLLESKFRAQWERFVMVGAVLVAISAGPIYDSLHADTRGLKIDPPDMQRLIELVQRDNMTCIGFTPFHPIYCRDATDLHNHWDVAMLKEKWASKKTIEKFQKMWAQAASAVERGEPDLVLCPDIWEAAYKHKGLDEEQYARFLTAVKAKYDCLLIGQVQVGVRKQQASATAVQNKTARNNAL